ncbi:MAG TPA: DUF2851 family protein [bacterium]|nr:DUF2851 family protein [bacterium]HOL47039.1 DUF2851 family protein [bacterium]HPQ18459.1 DUF2851 family protein [bacterium]
MPDEIKEDIIKIYCNKYLFKGKTFRDIENNIIKIIERGYYNFYEGPDFKDFTINTKNKIIKSDIEVETNLNNYFLHKHHIDNNYKNVKIIFVYELDNKIEKRINKQIVILKNKINKLTENDIIELKNYFLQSIYKTHLINKLKKLDKITRKKEIIKLGIKRFINKKRDIKNLIKKNGEKIGLIIKLFEITGYSRNKELFRRIAENIDWIKIINKLNYSSLNFQKEFFYNLLLEIFDKNKNEYLINKIEINYKKYKVYPRADLKLRINILIPILLKIISIDNFTELKEIKEKKRISELYVWFKEYFLFNKLKTDIQNFRIKSYIYNLWLPYLAIKYKNDYVKKELLNFPKITNYHCINYPERILELNEKGIKEIEQQGLLYLCR